MQNAEAVLAVLRERGRKRETSSRSRHKSLESPVHRKVPAGFGGRLRGKGPQQRDLAAQPILLPLSYGGSRSGRIPDAARGGVVGIVGEVAGFAPEGAPHPVGRVCVAAVEHRCEDLREY